jgi:hypothetical protein
MSTEPIPAAELDQLERDGVPQWLQQGIPLTVITHYMTLIRSMNDFNAGLDAWEQDGRPEPDGSDRYTAIRTAIYAAHGAMVAAALALSTSTCDLPDAWVRQYKLVIEDPGILTPIFRIVED